MTPLARHLATLIARDGPISVASFMAAANAHYYATRDPFGAQGDFVTAPEVSQMFGELIGLWSADTWHAQGAHAPAVLAELGPGRGTLMADALRAVRRAAPRFLDAATVHLVETSPKLRARQREILGERYWHDAIETLPHRPLFLIANEFFDALPVRQFVRAPQGWCERCVGLANIDAPRFTFVVAPDPVPDTLLPAAVRNAPPGSLAEIRPAGEAILAHLSERIQTHGGAALIIDYGHAPSAVGDTLQGVKAHAFRDPLEAPGEADLTAHVDFAALARAAEGVGARVHGPVTQGVFLERLGLSTRTAALKKGADAQSAAAIDAAQRRLVAADAMGTLFKAFAITPRAAPLPAGFAL